MYNSYIIMWSILEKFQVNELYFCVKRYPINNTKLFDIFSLCSATLLTIIDKLKNSKWTNCIFVSNDILTITSYYLTYFHYVLQFFWQRAFTHASFFFQIRMAWQSFELSHSHTTYSITNCNLVIYVYKSSKGLFTNYVDKTR